MVGLGCRVTGVVAYAASLAVFHAVYPLAAKAYNDFCASQGTTFGDGDSVASLIVGLIVIAVPLLTARSSAVVAINLIVSLIMLLGANGLWFTAGNTPYECFTQAGTYEDHTSGLEGFGLAFSVVVVVSYILLLIDWTVWLLSRGIAKWWPARAAADVKAD